MSHLIASYGYLAVFVAVAAESLGVPLPGETTLVAAAVYAGSTHRLAIGWVVVVAFCGAVLGDNAGYLIGRRGGAVILRRYGHVVGLNEARQRLGRYVFARHGAKVVFFGRFVTVLRTCAALLAGAAQMPFRRFLVYNAAGGALWATLFGVGAYLAGRVVVRVGSILTLVLVPLGIAAAIGGLVAGRRLASKLQTLADGFGRADSGPGPTETRVR